MKKIFFILVLFFVSCNTVVIDYQENKFIVTKIEANQIRTGMSDYYDSSGNDFTAPTGLWNVGDEVSFLKMRNVETKPDSTKPINDTLIIK
jgi:hypothetical protein